MQCITYRYDSKTFDCHFRCLSVTLVSFIFFIGFYSSAFMIIPILAEGPESDTMFHQFPKDFYLVRALSLFHICDLSADVQRNQYAFSLRMSCLHAHVCLFPQPPSFLL